MEQAIYKIFYPKSIAVIGASSKPNSLSWELVNNILKYGFQGKLFPVNPKSDFVHSMKAYKTLQEIQDEVDLAIIMLPRQLVNSAIDDCHKKNISSVVVITAGFREVGGEGTILENQLKEKISNYKMRLVGPNCMGIINTHPDIKLNGTFVLGDPLPGRIGFMSQSGALGAAVLKTVQQNDIGLSQFISLGNKADISGNAMLDFWKDNDDVKVITVYLESFGVPRRFMELTREITKRKPVIVVKSARSEAGMRAASSHTGALASADIVVDAFLKQGGCIRVNGIEEMFDLAKAFDKAKLPKGNRLGILTNAGGPAILAIDDAQNLGLTVPELTVDTQNKLKEIAPAEASLKNPVDLLPPATASMYEHATRLMLRDKNIDSLIVILGPPLMLDTAEIAYSICKGAGSSKKTVMLVLMSQDDIIPRLKELDPGHPPIFRFPEAAARAIGKMLAYKKWTGTPSGDLNSIAGEEIDKEAIRKILNSQKRKGEFYLDYKTVFEILGHAGFSIIKSHIAKNTKDTVKFANEIGYPVVLKSVGPELIHKTEAGVVKLDIQNDRELINARKSMLSKIKFNGIKEQMEGFLIQPYLREGIETIMGVFKDDKAGHLIMFGMGGIMVEIFNDVQFRLLPITDVESKDLIRSVKCYKLLKGFRGSRAVDIEFIEENLLKLSKLIEEFPEFTEIDLNPFVFSHKRSNCKILDARMKVDL